MSLGSLGPPARRRGRTLVLTVVVVAVVGGGIAAAWWTLRDGPPPGPQAAAAAVRDGLATGDVRGGPFGPDTTAAATRHSEAIAALDDLSRTVELAAVAYDEEQAPDRATATYQLAWDLPGERSWAYRVEADLRRTEAPQGGDPVDRPGTIDGWVATWSEALVHPEVPEGGRLTLERTSAPRAEVQDADGTPLVTDREVVDVGIQPSRVDDVDATVDAVRDVLGFDLAGLEDRVEAADPDLFVAVVTLRADQFTSDEEALTEIPGTIFRRDEQPLAPTSAFARATLGRAGPVTAEMIEDEPDRFQAGDVAGLSGLQRVYDDQLGGRPGLEVRAVGPDDSEPAIEPTTVFTAAAEAGEPVRVTLDERVQRAADEALAETTDLPSALVAVRVDDGHVLAVANGPANGGADLALTGRYPPGSTFKTVTTAALLEGGLDPDDTVSCPATAAVDGRSFRNAEDAELGDVAFRTIFAESCNTAFVTLAGDLADETLRDTAATFGVGREPELGMPAFGGEVPVTEPGTDQAAAAIGQGQVLVSPFALADLAASAARGGALPPSLVLDDGDGDTQEVTELPASVATVLPDLLREAVTDGTGSAVADVSGGPVLGKTGTAEYGDETPPRTHAWFLGAQEDVAFAVLVAETEDGQGGSTAAPLAARFLTALADG